jgi:ABC-type multidrug transport system permease subunit
MVVVINYSWAIGKILIGVAYFVYNSWYNFIFFFILVPFVLTFIFIFFILAESPVFLYRNGLKDQYIKSLKTIAEYNKVLFDERSISML